MQSSDSPKNKLWFYANAENEPVGPLSFQQLKQLRDSNTISWNTNVLVEGGEWEPYNNAVAFIDDAPVSKIGKPVEFLPKPSNTKPSSAAPKGIQEYRRTCKSCGKVWHSLVEREKAIEKDKKNNQRDSFQLCNSSTMSQAKHNIAANESELSRLRRCPECQSAIYREEIITHDA